MLQVHVLVDLHTEQCVVFVVGGLLSYVQGLWFVEEGQVAAGSCQACDAHGCAVWQIC